MNVEEHIKTRQGLSLNRRSIIHLTLVHHRIQDELNTALKPFEISLQQFNVLRILRGRNGKPANLSTINSRMVTKMSNTTRLVDKLLVKGLVSRQICPSNRRKVEIDITPAGLEMLEQIDLVIDKTEALLLEHLSKNELEELNSILDKINVQ